MPEMTRVATCFVACAPTLGLADSAPVTSSDASNALPRVATERVMKKLEARWREGDGVHWLLQVRSNLGERATKGAIAKMKEHFKAACSFKHGGQRW